MGAPNAEPVAPTAPPPATPPGPRRILHLLPDLERGGGQQVLLRTLRTMDADRYQNTVVYFGPPEELREPFAEVCDLRCIRPQGLRSAAAVQELLRAQNIDVVHVNGTPVDKLHGTYAAWKHGCPVLWTLHGMSPDTGYWRQSLSAHPRMVYKALKRAGTARLERFLDRRAIRHVLAVSDAVLDSWRPYLNAIAVPEQRISVSYNGVPLEEYDTDANRAAAERLRRELRLEDAYPILLMIGRLNEGKGQHHLVNMLKQVRERYPRVRLLLAGDGTPPNRAWFEAALREAGTSDSVLPLGNRNDVPDLLALSDLYVFASATEGFPLSVLEALAAARQVVAYRLPALERIVTSKNGRLVAPERDAMAAAIIELAGDPEALRRGGRRSREIVNDGYSMQAATQRLVHIYERLIAERQHA